MATLKAIVWKEGVGRSGEITFKLRRPCSCKCDQRGFPGLVGYLIGNVSENKGVTIPIFQKETLKALEAEFGKAE
jgi:hypothetical protein